MTVSSEILWLDLAEKWMILFSNPKKIKHSTHLLRILLFLKEVNQHVIKWGFGFSAPLSGNQMPEVFLCSLIPQK